MERWREYFEELIYMDMTCQQDEEKDARDEHEIDAIEEEEIQEAL